MLFKIYATFTALNDHILNLDCSVVILNWNGKQFLEQFLPSVVKYSKGADIIVVDNWSTDDSLDFIKKNYPNEVTSIELDQNYGFTGGYNKSIAKIKTRYSVLLNSDVEVSKNWLQPIIEMMNQDQMIAACQPKILWYKDKSSFEYAGAGGGYIDKYGYPFCRGRVFDTLETDTGQYDDTKEVFWATGACMFVRTEVYNNLGGLDEDFFAHMEEIDLCWRMQNTGYKVYYNGKSQVYHVGGGTLAKSNPKKTYLNFRNNLQTLAKNLPANKLLKTFLVRLFLDEVAALNFLLKGQIKNSLAIFRAYIYFIKNIRNLKEKRKEIKPKYLPKTTVYLKSIVVDYYLKKKKVFQEFINS